MNTLRPLMTISLALIFFSPYSAQMISDCGSFRTQTQGGWGTSAAGNNPGSYRDAHFGDAFPEGLTVGCNETILLTSSLAVEAFLPSGGQSSILTENIVDPSDYNNVLAGQLVALTLSVGFDSAYPDFSESEILLADMIISNGNLEGMAVSEVLTIANEILGGCSTSYSTSEINSVLSSINENYVDGEWDNGFLECPDQEPTELFCELYLENLTASCQNNDSLYTLTITMSGSNGSFTILSEDALSGNGQEFCFEYQEDSTLQSSTTVELTFEQGMDYSFQVIQMTDAQCSPSSTNECAIELTTGPSPDCCELEVQCPSENHLTYTCLTEIPPLDNSAIHVLSNCGETTITAAESSNGGGCYNDPMFIQRTYSIVSGGSEATCVEMFRLVDSIAPSISCPPTLIIDCSASTTDPMDWATATDNCDEAPVISYYDVPFSGCNGFNRMWTATDNCGNIAVCPQEVLFQDSTPPVIAIPNDVELECTASIDPIWTGNATAYDLCGDVDIDYADTFSESTSCARTITRTWTASDQCGNTIAGEQLITLVDLTGPVIYNVPPGTSLQCGEAPDPADAIAVDACSGDTLQVTMDEFISAVGCRTTIQRTYLAVDSCGNASTLTRNIIIEDTQSPTITCPTDVTLECGETGYSPDDIGYPEVMDNCSGTSVSLTYQDSEINMSACPPEILRQWIAVDTCGNSSNCIQRIYFTDTTPPSVECIDDAVVDCSMGETIDPEFTGVPIAFDDCSEVNMNYNDGPISGECPISFTRTWVIQDACFNAAFCQQLITIVDEQAPAISCSDVSVSCAYSNAAPSTTGMPDVQDCNSTSLIYTDGPITGQCPKSFIRNWTAIDLCGNSASCQQLISLEDNMIPVVFCPADTSVNCNADLSPASLGIATAIDFCSDVSVSHIDVEFDDGCSPYLERTWIATDACGNSRACTQTIWVVNTDELALTCPPDILIACDDSIEPSFTGSPSVNGNCGSIEISYEDSIYFTYDSLTTDDCGQLRTQTQGGWGTHASGNNPGSYRDENFDTAFPNGVSIGCDNSILFTSSNAVEQFLPSGTSATQLTLSYVNPVNYRNVFAGQVLALTLSVGFDLYDSGFGSADIALGDMHIKEGEFAGYTVSQILDLANQVLGGCTDDYSISSLNGVVSSINENYVDGISNNGFLTCPGDEMSESTCFSIIRNWTIVLQCSDTLYCAQIIQGYDNEAAQPYESVEEPALQAFPSPTSGLINVKSMSGFQAGDIIRVLDSSGILLSETISNGLSGELLLDLNQFESGLYLIQWQGTPSSHSIQVVKN